MHHIDVARDSTEHSCRHIGVVVFSRPRRSPCVSRTRWRAEHRGRRRSAPPGTPEETGHSCAMTPPGQGRAPAPGPVRRSRSGWPTPAGTAPGLVGRPPLHQPRTPLRLACTGRGFAVDGTGSGEASEPGRLRRRVRSAAQPRSDPTGPVLRSAQTNRRLDGGHPVGCRRRSRGRAGVHSAGRVARSQTKTRRRRPSCTSQSGLGTKCS